jgi:hypothetical protein
MCWDPMTFGEFPGGKFGDVAGCGFGLGNTRHGCPWSLQRHTAGRDNSRLLFRSSGSAVEISCFFLTPPPHSARPRPGLHRCSYREVARRGPGARGGPSSHPPSASPRLRARFRFPVNPTGLQAHRGHTLLDLFVPFLRFCSIPRPLLSPICVNLRQLRIAPAQLPPFSGNPGAKTPGATRDIPLSRFGMCLCWIDALHPAKFSINTNNRLTATPCNA